MKALSKSSKERKYFIDWLRITLILSVFFFHIGMIFNSWGWHVKSEQPVLFLEPIMAWLHLWRMPLLFLVSGVGTFYALGHRTSKQYLKERFSRIFIPFLVGVFTLVPVQVYIEKIDSYSSLGNFYLNMFDGIYPIGNFSWHHLWFLIYLFIISLIISPFLNYLKSNKFQNVQHWMIQKTSTRLGLNWVLPILIASQWILRQYFPESTHALLNDWAYFTYYLIFFLCGFMLFTSDKVINALAGQRRLYLVQTLLFTAIMFSFWIFEINIAGKDLIYGITEIIIAWSCGLSALGYFKVYFNNDNKYRKHLNVAIYPFYLLHQPVIIVVGYLVLKLQMPTIVSAVLITLLSLSVITGLYWIIGKSNFLRTIFGMKKIPGRQSIFIKRRLQKAA
jgi:peptidoglycan/LPS O-acetylase OafA/YrhL